MRWFQGMSYPIQSGAPCIGCSNAHFWDEGKMSERLPKFGQPIGDVDKIGAAIAGVTAVGVAAHGAASVIQKKKRDAAKEEENGEQVNK